MIVNAFDNPRLATKYEAEIGALMAKTAKGETKSFSKHIPASSPVKQDADRKRNLARPIVIKLLMKHGPMARNALTKLIIDLGHKVPRDAAIHAMIEGHQAGYISVFTEHGVKKWFICNEKLAQEFLVRSAPANV